MQELVRDTRESVGHTYAEPLSGLRVSWGSVLAGAITTLAVSLILWALALAIVSLAAHADAHSMRSSGIALWICAMGATLVGAFVGGWFAGYLPGNPRPSLGAMHGFLAWAMAFVLSFAFQFFVIRGVAATAANAFMTGTAIESGEIGGESPGATVPGSVNPNSQVLPPAPTSQDVTRAAHTAIDTMVAIGWSWFGTWAAALLLATGAGAAAARRAGEEPTGLYEERERRIGPPFTPAPTA